MSSHMWYRWAASGRRTSGHHGACPRSLRPLAMRLRFAASSGPLASATGRRVGDRPLPGKETGACAGRAAWLLGITPL